MKNKNSGFSLIELLAILLITTVLIVPLLSTLIGNVELNSRAKLNRSATSIAESTLYGLEKIDFSDFRGQLDIANGSTFFIEYSKDQCDNLSSTSDELFCTEVFSAISNNFEPDSTEYKVYMFNYSLTSAQHNFLVNGSTIEQSAKDVIDTNTDILAQIGQTDVSDLIRVVVWIDYHDDPDLYVIIPGLIFND